MGPLAFVSDHAFNFGDARQPTVGDWVLYHRRGYSMRFQYNKVECLMIEQEKVIKAILDRPDVIW